MQTEPAHQTDIVHIIMHNSHVSYIIYASNMHHACESGTLVMHHASGHKHQSYIMHYEPFQVMHHAYGSCK